MTTKDAGDYGFRSERQRHEALACLLREAGIRGYWTRSGPTGKDVLALTQDDAILLGVAYAIADRNGDRLGTLDDVLWKLSRERAREVLSLLVAVGEGPAGVDAWIAKHALALRGQRLCRMHGADDARWRAAVLEGIASARSKVDLAFLLDVELRTVYRWLEDPVLAAAMAARVARLDDPARTGELTVPARS